MHRDIKPGNIMLTTTGVKLLDFGLAKRHSAVVLDRAKRSRTDLTLPGLVLGTALYMAPEQLDGKEVDGRTDLFAFGAVLFEMLAGRKAFDAPSDATLIAAIMSSNPPSLSQVRAEVPEELDYAVTRCLAKDPDDRWQTARDLHAELLRVKSNLDPKHKPAKRLTAADRRTRWPILVAGAAVVALVASSVAVVLQPAGEQPVLWLSVLPPPDGFDVAPDPAVSPDGRYVAFKAQDESHQTHIWLKPLDAASAIVIPGTEGTEFSGAHFWSPDSRSIGFFAAGKLKRIDLDGDTAQVLAAAPEPRGGTWTPNGVIIFNADAQTLMRVPASGGPASRIADSENGGVRLFPHALPDGRHYLFTSRNADGQGLGVYVGDLDAAGVRRISDAWSPAMVANGHLLFVGQGALFAQPFDLDDLAVRGEPEQIASGVGLGVGTPLSFAFSASPAGLVAYWGGSATPTTQLTWLNRSGVPVSVAGDSGQHIGFTLDDEARRAVVERRNFQPPSLDIWLLDPQRWSGASRLTADSPFSTPVLAPDGRRLVAMERGRGLVTVAIADGTVETLVEGSTPKWPTDWSLDDRLVAFADTTPSGDRLWTTASRPGGEPQLYREAPFKLAAMTFSPSGDSVAYMSNESGRFEVYVDSYPTPDQRIRASMDGGGLPRWRRDGKELYYLAPNRNLMVVDVQMTARGLTLATPEVLFEGPAVNPDWTRPQFAPSSDGTKFLFNARLEDTSPVGLTVIANWERLLAK